MIFAKNLKLKKNSFYFSYIQFFFSYYCCSIDLKRQSEHSGLRPDTSSLVSFVWKKFALFVQFTADLVLSNLQTVEAE